MVIGELLRQTNTWFTRKTQAPGDALTVQGVGLGKGVKKVTAYQQAGLLSRPPKGTIHIVLPVGEGRNEMYAIAAHNYKINFIISEGETTIFSTSEDGATLKARIDLDNTGKIKISNQAKSLKTIIDSLSTALTTFATGLNSGTLTAQASSLVTAVSTFRADIALLLKD
jgi:phage gp45-like